MECVCGVYGPCSLTALILRCLRRLQPSRKIWIIQTQARIAQSLLGADNAALIERLESHLHARRGQGMLMPPISMREILTRLLLAPE